MKKHLIILFLLFQGFVSPGQIRTATYEGRTVKVFPYRVEGRQGGIDEYAWSDYAIPYCPEKLEDGEYILYFRTYFNLEKMRLDSFNIAAIFTISSGLRNGAVLFYEFHDQKKPSGKGFYKNDLKTGTWKIEIEYYQTVYNTKALPKNIKKHERLSAQYLEGKFEGKMVIEDLVKKKKKILSFKNGLHYGTEEVYLNNKLYSYQSYRNGNFYGPYMAHANEVYITVNELDGYNPEKTIIKGFKLDASGDSITQIFEKNKLKMAFINSDLPFNKTDTTDKDWYIDMSYFIGYIKPYGRYYWSATSVIKNHYMNIYEMNKNGKRFNDFYLINSSCYLQRK